MTAALPVLRAKPFAKLELGVDLQHSIYDDEYRQVATTPGATVATFIPDIETRITTLKLTAKVAFIKNAGLRVDYAFQRWTSDDWTWPAGLTQTAPGWFRNRCKRFTSSASPDITAGGNCIARDIITASVREQRAWH